MAIEKTIKIVVQGVNEATGPLGQAGQAIAGLGGMAASAALGGISLATGNIIGLGMAAVGFIGSANSLIDVFIQIGDESLSMAMDFQDAMVVLEFAILDLDVPMETIHDAVIKVGEDVNLFGVNAVEAAEGVTTLALAGLSTGEIFGDLTGYMEGTAEAGGILKDAINLAAASTLGLNEAAEFGVVILSNFGGELETEAERLAFVSAGLDHTVRAADASIASVDDLTQSYRTVGSTMAGFGFTLEETNTLLAMLSDRGIKGSEAGTALKSVFTNLFRETKKVRKALADYNIELFDNEGNMHSAIEIIGQLQRATADLTEEERVHLIQTLAGSYGQRAAFALIDEGTEGYLEMTTAIRDATSMQEKAEARTTTLSGKMETFDGVVETLKITIGEELIPAGTELVELFTVLVVEHGPAIASAMEEVGRRLYNLSTFFTMLNRNAGEFKEAFIRVGDVLRNLNHPITNVLNAIRQMPSAFNEIRHWISVIVDKFNHLKSTLAGFNLPDWLTPGSPTPLETGLLGIGKALAEVRGLAGGGLNFGGMTLAGAGAGLSRGGSITIINNFGPGSVRDDQDILDISDAITQNLELRGAGPVF